MYQILYTSKALHPFNDNELETLLATARENNSKKSITGMLLYCNSNFIQLLEGNEKDLSELFDIISSDGRHYEVKKIMENHIKQPQFPDWSMGYKYLSAEQLTNINSQHHIDVASFILQTQPFKLLKLMSAKSWN